MPSLDGTFCGVSVAIDYLKVWQAPKIEQLRPRQITVFAPQLEIVGRGGQPNECERDEARPDRIRRCRLKCHRNGGTEE
jgi:hypothetical protein